MDSYLIIIGLLAGQNLQQEVIFSDMQTGIQITK